MKKTGFWLGVIVATMLTALTLTGCEDTNRGSVKEMTFKRMDINGAKAIALVSDASTQHAPARAMRNEDEPQFNVSNPVYSVSDDGKLVEVHYTIEVIGDGEVVDMVKANMRLVMQYIYPIGDEWLWLVNCEYNYPNLDEVKEPLHGQIQELINNGNSRALNFLVRKSDGALFQWKREEGCPGAGMGYKQPSDIYGVVEAMGKDLYSCAWYDEGGSTAFYGQVFKLEDHGNELHVITMLNSTQTSMGLLPDNRGFFGSYILYNNPTGSEYEASPALILPDKPGQVQNLYSQPTHEQVPYANLKPISINGTVYALGFYYENEDGNGWPTSGGLLELEHFTTPMEAWVATNTLMTFDADFAGHLNNMSLTRPYKSTTVWWLSSGWNQEQGDYVYMYAIDPVAGTSTKRLLPTHYPGEEDLYYDGIAYVVGNDNNSIFICDLSKDAAEEVPVDWSGASEYLMQVVPSTMTPFSAYDPNTQSFSAGASLTDGTTVYFLMDAQGPNRGKVRAIHEGESDAGQVISVMVRLN